MKNSAELLGVIEERLMGWSYDITPRTLLYALSRIPELPKHIDDDAKVLSKMVIKCEALAIFRSSLERLTIRDHRVSVKPADEKGPQTLSLPPLSTGNDAVAITALIAEIKRLENELSSTPVDYVGILRFIREKLK